MSDVEMPEELDIDREDLSLSNEIVESDEDNREAIVCGGGRASLRTGSSACVTEKMPTLLHALANLRSSQITFSSSLRTGSSACVTENADSASVYFNVRPPCLRYKSSLLSASRLSQLAFLTDHQLHRSFDFPYAPAHPPA
ncbi:hypothetical protein ACLKA7_005047 [Drosophila subpalustris]